MRSTYRQSSPNRIPMLSSRYGFTVVELMAALFISMLLLFGIMRIYFQFTTNTTALKKGSVVQQEVVQLNHIMEKDIRIAGLNLPGNGIVIDNGNPTKNEMYLFYNDTMKTAQLLETAPVPLDSNRLVVDKDSAAKVDMYVCLFNANYTEYAQIIGIKHRQPGSDRDTLIVDHNLINEWKSPMTLYFAYRTHYRFDGAKNLIRTKDGHDYTLSKDVSRFYILPRDENGGIMPKDSARWARSVTATLEKFINTPQGLVLVRDSCQANMRNYN